MKILEGTTASVPPQGGRKHPHQEFIQIDTTNVLFICGGAFAGLESIIESRMGRNSVGFGAKLRRAADHTPDDLFAQVLPEDLLKFGLIPEFVGRLAGDRLGCLAGPRVAHPDPCRAAQRPGQAVPEAVRSRRRRAGSSTIARSARSRIRRCCAAPAPAGLRAILEEVLLGIMYDLPSEKDAVRVEISEHHVREKVYPTVVRRPQGPRVQRPRRAAS